MRDTPDMIFEINVANGRYRDSRNLTRFDTRVYSQYGQDGWIAEIFNRIGTTNRFFVEVGVENGTECNSRLLLEQGWHGVWIDGGPHVAAAAQIFQPYVAAGTLKIVDVFVTAENVNDILNAASVPEMIDFLGVDIDMNTSHIWRAITRSARVCDIEYNASLPCSTALEVPYHPQGVWSGSNYFGASLKVMEMIGREKGMALVGSEPSGVDAFFVREASPDQFQTPFSAEYHWEPCRYERFAKRGHPPDPNPKQYVHLP